MKFRNREINVFSMSALDLFASALGAFILIAVVLFPYFPNTGDSAERVADVKKELEAAQAQLEQKEQELQAQAEELEQAKKFKLPHTDLVIALDVTGSMGEVVAGLKREISGLTRILSKLAPSVGIGVVAFGDRHWSQEQFVHALKEVSASSGNMSALKRFINSLRTDMGKGSGSNNDQPEALANALRTAIGMPWRAESEKRIVVIITDNAAYPEERGAAIARAQRFAASGTQQVSTVIVPTRGTEPAARPFLKRLAEAGRGEAVSGGASITSSILESLL